MSNGSTKILKILFSKLVLIEIYIYFVDFAGIDLTSSNYYRQNNT